MVLKNNLGKLVDLYQFKKSITPLERGYLTYSKSKDMYLVVFIDEILLAPNFIPIDEHTNRIEILTSVSLEYSLDSLKKDILEDQLYDWSELSLDFGMDKINPNATCINCKHFSLLNFFCYNQCVNKEKNDMCSNFYGV
jgi:hypothetical protein